MQNEIIKKKNFTRVTENKKGNKGLNLFYLFYLMADGSRIIFYFILFYLLFSPGGLDLYITSSYLNCEQ